jgi:hypothetical protein
MMRTEHAGWLVVCVIAVAGAPRAWAQSTSAQAQSLFDDGRRLLADGKLTEACSAFDASQKLDPAVTTLLNLADCREQNHQLATAWGTFSEANRIARGKNDKLARVAAAHAKKLEPRLSKLTIVVPVEHQIAGLEVLRNDEPVIAAAWNHALPIDGGSYTILARAPGHAPWSGTKTIQTEADAVTITVPVLADKPAAVADDTRRPGPAPEPVPPGPGESGVQPTATIDRPSRLPVVPIAIAGGALVLGGVALGFDLSGNHLYDRARAATDDQAQRDSLEHQANTRRYTAEVFGGAAVVAAGAAVYLYVRGRGDHRTETAVAPVASAGLAGLAVIGEF